MFILQPLGLGLERLWRFWTIARHYREIFRHTDRGQRFGHDTKRVQTFAHFYALTLSNIQIARILPKSLRARISFDDAEAQPERAVPSHPGFEMSIQNLRHTAPMKRRSYHEQSNVPDTRGEKIRDHVRHPDH